MLETLAEVARRLGPAAAAAIGVLTVIVGVLIIAYPELLVWLVGIAFILGGIGVLAAAISTTQRPPRF